MSTITQEPASTTIDDRPSLTRIITCAVLLAACGLALAGYYLNPADDAAATRPIAQIRLGDRVAGSNPDRSQVDGSSSDVDPATWRAIRLTMTKPAGNQLDFSLLRSADWLEQVGATPGGYVFVDLPEIGSIGIAEVLAIEPCPPIKPGTGNIVTGTFKHETNEPVMELFLTSGTPRGPPPSIVGTANHPFWSIDRQKFVELGDLYVGETLDLSTGSATVARIERHPPVGHVYNIEVWGEHVYRVGHSGVLVHNNEPCTARLRKAYERHIAKHGTDSISFEDFSSRLLDRFHGVQRVRGVPASRALPKGIRSYVRDLEVQTGRKLHSRQIDLLKDNLRSRRYSKLSKADTARHRRKFDSVKDNLIAEWERQTGQSWPRYNENLPKTNGKPGFSRLKGDPYDAHHVIENELGGPAEWWNIHPARFPGQHQGGIHRSGSPLRHLLDNID